MQYVVTAFLCLSIILYFLLGGADFGAGVIELFTSKKNRNKTRNILYHAIGPIWEANHMWLIIAIVILFVGFPAIYTTMSLYLHIPLLCMLMGIIARGTAFVFRSYDAVKDNMQRVYNRIFIISSFITPLFLGIIAGSAIAGHIDDGATNFLDAYIFSWLHWFSLAVGLFTVALSGFLAAIYLIGEVDEQNKRRFVLKARGMNIAAVICGALVFIAARAEGIPLAYRVFGNAEGLTALLLAAASLVLLWVLILRGDTKIIRVLAGFQVVMILFAAGHTFFPDFIIMKSGHNLSLLQNFANPSTIAALGAALLIASVFILPALGYLMYSFQKKGD
jgi:cytochrome d ubiquinol oxidase subunit II